MTQSLSTSSSKDSCSSFLLRPLVRRTGEMTMLLLVELLLLLLPPLLVWMVFPVLPDFLPLLPPALRLPLLYFTFTGVLLLMKDSSMMPLLVSPYVPISSSPSLLSTEGIWITAAGLESHGSTRKLVEAIDKLFGGAEPFEEAAASDNVSGDGWEGRLLVDGPKWPPLEDEMWEKDEMSASSGVDLLEALARGEGFLEELLMTIPPCGTKPRLQTELCEILDALELRDSTRTGDWDDEEDDDDAWRGGKWLASDTVVIVPAVATAEVWVLRGLATFTAVLIVTVLFAPTVIAAVFAPSLFLLLPPLFMMRWTAPTPPLTELFEVDVELLLSLELLLLSTEFFFCLRRRARGAVATSCRRNPFLVAWWNASIVQLIWSWTAWLWEFSTPGVRSGAWDSGGEWIFLFSHLCLSSSCMRSRSVGSTVSKPLMKQIGKKGKKEENTDVDETNMEKESHEEINLNF